MKNFATTINNKEYWISRSVAVAVFIFTSDMMGQYVLANKRGKGTPDFQGYWNCPCGYLDYDETLEQAAVRETLEETGYILKPEELKIIGIQSEPEDSDKQNVTIRFCVYVTDQQLQNITIKNAEKDEVSDIWLINVEFLDNYNWAFNHDNIIKKILKESEEQNDKSNKY